MRVLLSGIAVSVAFLAAKAQNVGIGTNSPIHRLHVSQAAGNVQVKLEGLDNGSEVMHIIKAGNNDFNTLIVSKYAPATTGTLFGINKAGLSAIFTGGNGGPLLVGTGDGVSPLIFATGTGERMRLIAAGRLGLGTTNPALANNFHVHSSDVLTEDVSIGITNSMTTDASLRGARLRMLNKDFHVINYETNGKLTLSTNFNIRMTINEWGKVGIGTTNPQYKLDIAESGDNSRGINLVMANGFTNTSGIYIANFNNLGAPGSYTIGLHAVVGDGGTAIVPGSQFAVIGESRNTNAGVGVYGTSNSPSPDITQGAITGNNFGAAALSYGVIGYSLGSSGAGVAGVTTNATAGLLGHAKAGSTGPAIKATSLPGSTNVGLELENGAIKVSGANRSVFQHQATVANISGNQTIIPNTTLANHPTDLLIVTPFWDAVYVKSPIGVYFNGVNWSIFRQDEQPMPVGAKFNVLVVKQ